LSEKKKKYTQAHDHSLQRIVNQLEGHLEKLKHDFNADEDFKLEQEQHRIEMQLDYERL